MKNSDFQSLSRVLAQRDANGGAVAFDGQNQIGWSEFASAVWHLSHIFSEHTARRWILFCEDACTFAMYFFALLYAGKEILLPPNKQIKTLQGMQKYADAIVSDFQNETSLPHLLAEDGLSPAVPTGKFPVLDAAKSQIELFTSGSQGEPKRVVKTLQQLDTEIAELNQHWGASLSASVVFSTVSHQHIYGLLFSVLWPLAAGRPFQRQIIRYPEEFSQPGKAHEKAVLISSPAFLRALPEDMLAQFAGLFSRVFSSGGALDKTTAGHIGGSDPNILTEVYGSTETGGIAFRYPVIDGGWQPFPNIQIARDDAGRLLIQSPYLSTTDWHTTDDLIQILESERFELLGRADSVVKIQEKRVSLREIEQLICQLPEIKDCAALVIDSINLKRRQIACVVSLSDEGKLVMDNVGPQAMNAKLRDLLSGYLDAVVLPKKWRYVDKIELNSQGKRNQAALKELFKPVFNSAVLQPHVISLLRDNLNVTAQLRVPRDLAYFEGHFPDQPILPGIVQLNWAVQFASQHFMVAQPVRRVRGLKFQRVIYPAQLLELRLTYEPAEKRLGFQYSSENLKHSGGAIFFQ